MVQSVKTSNQFYSMDWEACKKTISWEWRFFSLILKLESKDILITPIFQDLTAHLFVVNVICFDQSFMN
jgi:hypothetical protein